jgi:hypothetical protein
MLSALNKTKAVLVVGHPGHELRVYGWMAATQPVVHVITDGSGHGGASRVHSTNAVLHGVGATRGSIYGRMTDREIYAAMLDGDHDRFITLAEELADSFVRDRVDVVAGDAVEGFNPSHDVCRHVINAAVRLASLSSGRPIACYAFPLEAAPSQPPERRCGEPLQVRLDAPLLERKLQAAHAYSQLQGEVARALDRFGAELFRTEYLWPVDLDDPYAWDPDGVPFYESYGAQRVTSGTYQRVVTFGQHVKPLADALWCHCAARV